MAMRTLRIPGVVRLIDDGPDGEDWLLVMELVEGEPFPGAGVVGAADVVKRTIALLQVLAEVHQAGFVHGDLKPSNVLVAGKGEVTVVDFGLVTRLDERGLSEGITGTPEYMAPEQFWGGFDNRADLYAIGWMAYEAICGVGPIANSDPFARMACEPTPMSVFVGSTVFGEVVDRLVRREPEHRFPNATEAVRALLADANTRGLSVHRPGVPIPERISRDWFGCQLDQESDPGWEVLDI